jgi:DNA-directed RNA polymerase III subunit RPC3
MKELKLYTSTLSTLLQQSYIRPTSALSHISPRDRVLQYEAELKKGRRGLLSAKDLREIKESAEARLRREVEEEEESGMVCIFYLWT